jgi:secreted trypsin-like serine protease
MRSSGVCVRLAAACMVASGAIAHAAPVPHIIGGDPSDAATYPATGMLITHAGGGTTVDCTATLIAPDVALTAAHCLPVPYFGLGLEFSLDTDARDGMIDNPINVIVAHPHPDFQPTRTDTVDLTNAADIAVLILATPIPSVVPEQIDGVLDIADVHSGMDLELVGYGLTKWNSQQPNGLKQQATVTIDRTETYEFDTTNQGAQPCYGDSGGPLFSMPGAPRRMIGLVSRAHGAITTCNSGAIVTRVEPYVNWVFQAAADRSNHTGSTGGDCSAGGGGLGLPLVVVWPAIVLWGRRRRQGLAAAAIRTNDRA